LHILWRTAVGVLRATGVRFWLLTLFAVYSLRSRYTPFGRVILGFASRDTRCARIGFWFAKGHRVIWWGTSQIVSRCTLFV
jgi:hypothetical protein